MKPFEGYRILDLTHVLAGPFSAFQLAVMGADVIKIEPPHQPDMMRPEGALEDFGDRGMGVHFMAQASNKRSLALDLRDPDGRDIFLNLVAGADVVVENFCADVMEGFDLGYDVLREVNPRIIYCTVTGFGHTGPKRNHPAYDNVIQAFSGLMAATGTPGSAPVRVGPPVLDYGTGAQTAFSIAAALLQRERTGKGQRIDVAMLDAALMLMCSTVVDTQARGSAPVPPGNGNPANAGYACYPTADGLLMIGAFTVKQHVRLWTALGCPDRGAEIMWAGHKCLRERVAEHAAELTELLAVRTAAEWEDILNEAEVPAARVRTLDEALAHPQVATRGVLQDGIVNPTTGSAFRMPVAAAMFGEHGPELLTPPPELGRDSDQVLAEAGLRPDEIETLKARGVVG